MNDINNGPKPYLSPYIGGIIVGIVLFLSFFLVGKGLGGSGAYTRVVAVTMNSVAPEHTEKLSYFQRYLGGTTHALDNWLVYMMVGVFIGALLSGIRNRRMKVEVLRGPNIKPGRRLLFAFIGGILVAQGARLAGGCTSGHALTGGAMLGVAGWIFFISVFISGFIVAYFMRKQWI